VAAWSTYFSGNNYAPGPEGKIIRRIIFPATTCGASKFVAEALSQCTDPARPSDIGITIGETPLNVGHDLYELGKGGLAEKPDKKKSLWLITNKGHETVGNPPANWVKNLTGDTQEDTQGETQGETQG